MLRLIRNTFYFLIIIGIFGCVLLFMYALKLEKKYHLDDRTLDGALWSIPARVYARPLEIYRGATLSADDLVNELRLLDYREVANLTDIKQFRRDGDSVEWEEAVHREQECRDEDDGEVEKEKCPDAHQHCAVHMCACERNVHHAVRIQLLEDDRTCVAHEEDEASHLDAACR